MTTALERGEGSASRPGRPLPPGKTRYPLYRRLGGSQGRSGQVLKIMPSTGIRSPDRPARSQSLYWLHYPAHCLRDNAKKYCRVGQATDDNTSLCNLYNWGYKHTLRICNSHFFSTAKIVPRTRLSVTWYVHCFFLGGGSIPEFEEGPLTYVDLKSAYKQYVF